MESLGISLPTLIAQLIAFGILFVLLRVFAYKPILKMLDERAKRVKESMEQTEQIKTQAAHAEEAVKQQIEAGRKEGQEIITRAAHTGEELRQKAEQEAKKQGEALITKARDEIQRERDEAIGELRHEFADLAITAAEKVIDRSLDKEAHRQLINKVLEENAPKNN